MGRRFAAFQNSYSRAAAAVMLWLAGGLLPVLVVSARKPSVSNIGGLAFAFTYALYGISALRVAVRERQWSDIIVFGVVPATLLIISIVALVLVGSF